MSRAVCTMMIMIEAEMLRQDEWPIVLCSVGASV